MKFYHRKFSFYFSAFILFLFCFAGVSAYGQTEPSKPAPSAKNQITADETIELNIIQERITEANFARSTDVALSDAARGNLRVEVGVGVRAESIDVILRGIFGRVRFRASLESLQRRIERVPMGGTQNSKAPNR